MRRSPASNGGRRATPRRRRYCSRRTCSWTQCAAASRPGHARASTSSTSRRTNARCRNRSILTRRRTSGRPPSAPLKNPGSIRLPGAEDLRKLVRRRDLELIVAAVLRLLVEAPALEDCGVAEPRPLHVVVLHL